MIIRKTFEFSFAHIVRNCYSTRCKHSIHAHTYKLELIIDNHNVRGDMDSYTLDNAQMLLDFGILKTTCKQVIKLFDGSGVLWDKDAKGFKDFFKYRMWSEIIEVPFNPTAEQLSKFFAIVFYMFLTSKIKYANNERIDKDIDVTVKVHETDTGYAQYTAGSEPYTFKKYDEYVKHLKFYNKMEDAQYLFDLEQIKLEEPNQQVKG